MSALKMAQSASMAANGMRLAKAIDRDNAIKKIATLLREQMEEIVNANEKDLTAAKAQGLSDALIDRLKIDIAGVEAMASTAESIADQDEVVGEIISEQIREDGLKIQKQRIPLGVIAMIFESRPNVVIDCSCLSIKSGNAILLKGGKEAAHSNKILCNIVRDAIDGFLPENSVQLVEAREEVSELIKLKDYVDVVIPRGGEKLIEYVYNNAAVPVIAHFKGLCHIYTHYDANLEQAKDIILNAKAQRPGVCNALETLILNKKLPETFVIALVDELKKVGVEVRGDSDLESIVDNINAATEEDFATEYLDMILSIKMVDTVEEAIVHIQKYGSHHTEGILAQDPHVIIKFQAGVDASCVTVNASTRFNDGGELGLGAELGISTTKFHAYGPMGAREMTTTRFLVVGDGHIRS